MSAAESVTLAASTTSSGSLFSQVAPILLVLLVVVLVGAIVIYAARRAAQPGESSDVPFTLQDLRDLHAQGKLSDEEFARAKEAMIGRLKAQAESAETGKERDSST